MYLLQFEYILRNAIRGIPEWHLGYCRVCRKLTTANVQLETKDGNVNNTSSRLFSMPWVRQLLQYSTYIFFYLLANLLLKAFKLFDKITKNFYDNNLLSICLAKNACWGNNTHPRRQNT